MQDSNPDPDVRQICPKMLWMHYLVSISLFAKYGAKRPLPVWQMPTSPKIPIPQRWRKWKSDPESTYRSDHHQKL